MPLPPLSRSSLGRLCGESVASILTPVESSNLTYPLLFDEKEYLHVPPCWKGSNRFYLDRIAGRHCDHCRTDRLASACRAGGIVSRASFAVCQQPEAAWDCAAQLPRHDERHALGPGAARLQRLELPFLRSPTWSRRPSCNSLNFGRRDALNGFACAGDVEHDGDPVFALIRGLPLRFEPAHEPGRPVELLTAIAARPLCSSRPRRTTCPTACLKLGPGNQPDLLECDHRRHLEHGRLCRTGHGDRPV